MKYSILSIVFLLFFYWTYGQKNQSQTSNGQEDYYLKFWNNNLDSLSDSWKIKQLLRPAQQKTQSENTQIHQLSSEECKQLFLKLDTTTGLKYHDRVEEILNFYLSKKEKLSIAQSYSNFLETEFEIALAKNNLPINLKNLPIALSAMNNKCIDKTGAAGIWVLMYANARRQGLRIDSYVDERRDAHKATQAAVKELKAYFDLYKNWELALAAYACGPTNVNKAIRRNNNSLDFYTIYASLPDFGRDIVPAFTAACMLDTLSKEQRMNNLHLSFATKVDTIEISQRLHFVQIQDILHIPLEELRYLNPIYKYDIVPAVNEIFHIYLPAGNLAKFNELEDSIYHYKDTILFDLKKPVVLPPAAKGRHYARYEPELPPDNSTLLYYTIKSGDNLGYIASWYGVKVRQIEDWNNIYDPRRLKLGKKLKIYVPENKASYYKGVDAMSFEQKQKRVGKTVSASSAASHAPKKEEPLGKDFFWYTVKSGESPYTIAKKYPGVSADDILRWNNITNARNIKVGQKLKIKRVK